MEKDTVKPVSIIVDSRESRAATANKLATFPGVTVEGRELSSGDYIIADGVAIERKSATDFINSVMSGHLFDQIARMALEYETTIVLIEGNPYDTQSAISPEAIDGAISYLALLSGVNTVFSPGLAATPRIIWRLALHATHGLGYAIPLRASKPKPPSLLASYIVEGLPSVGPTVAKKLLNHFSTPIAIFNASVPELMKCSGVGEKTAVTIYEALRKPIQL